MGFDSPGLKVQFYHLLHVEMCVSCLTSLSFSILFDEEGMALLADAYETASQGSSEDGSGCM